MKKEFWIGIAAIVISLIALGFSLMRVVPFMPDEATYIGIIATFMGVCATFIVIFQIFNAVEVKSEIKNQNDEIRIQKEDIQKRKEEIEAALKQFEILKNDIQSVKHEANEGLYYVLGYFKYERKNYLDSLGYLHSSICESVQYESQIRDTLLANLNQGLQSIDSKSFGENWNFDSNKKLVNADNITFEEMVKEATEQIVKDSNEMKKFKYYEIIKKEHQQFLSDLKAKFDQIEKEIRIEVIGRSITTKK